MQKAEIFTRRCGRKALWRAATVWKKGCGIGAVHRPKMKCIASMQEIAGVRELHFDGAGADDVGSLRLCTQQRSGLRLWLQQVGKRNFEAIRNFP